MKAVILAAGKGTRMKDLTIERPKPMLFVKGKPILQYIIEGLLNVGIKQIFIVTGYKPEVIEDYFNEWSRFGAQICYGRRDVQARWCRAPLVAREFVGNDNFLLTYGDILVKPENYSEILNRFNPEKNDGVITVTKSEDYTKGGLLFFDDKFFLRHLVEKPNKEQIEELKKSGFIKDGIVYWYNAGIYIFKPKIYDFIYQIEKSPRGEYELTDAILKYVQAGNKLVGYEIEGRWVDVRDPVVLAKLESEQPQ